MWGGCKRIREHRCRNGAEWGTHCWRHCLLTHNLPYMVQSCDGQALAEGTVVCSADRKAIGVVEEVFGPVVNVHGYATLDEAIARANALPFAFQSAVFSKHIDVAMRCVQQLEAAAVMVNDHTAFRVDWMPFAGHQHAGYSTGGMRYTMRDMTAEKLVVMKM